MEPKSYHLPIFPYTSTHAFTTILIAKVRYNKNATNETERKKKARFAGRQHSGRVRLFDSNTGNTLSSETIVTYGQPHWYQTISIAGEMV